MKKVLVISFDFPPLRTSAVYRMTGLTKYLVRFGWQPTVLAADVKEGDRDPTLLERIPSQVRIVRARYWPIARWEKPAATAIRRLGALRSLQTGGHQTRLDRYLRSLGDMVRSCLYFPDSTVGWVPFGLAKAIQLHREQPFDAVYSTNPPRAAPVIGLLLKVLFRVPWVLEFMDAWYPPNRLLRRKFECWLQLLMLREADAVVVMTNGHKQEFRCTYRVSGDKLAVVRNGFDEDDFNSGYATKRNFFAPGYVHLTHFGTIYQNFHGIFFPALAEFVQECTEARRRLRVNIIGYPDENVRQYACNGPLKDVIQIHGLMQHKDALQAMQSSHCLLLFWGNQYISRLSVASKIYEYLRAGRPILAVTYDGEVKELVEEGKAGWVVQPTDSGAIKHALRTILNESRNEIPSQPVRPEFVAQFRYDRLAANLAKVLDGVVRDDR